MPFSTSTDLQQSQARLRIFQAVLLGSYAVLLAFTLYRHEFWRDEMQAWNLITSSSGIIDLFRNKVYEGHPSLWFLILFPVGKLSHSPFSIQVVNWIISVAAAWLLIYRSLFRPLEKTLLLFGYFILFEYSVISRNYMIGVLILFGVATLWKSYQRNWIVICALIWLLIQTNAYMACVALAAFGTLLFRHWSSSTLWTVRTFLGILLVLSGLVFFVVSTNPPPDGSYASGWNFSVTMGGIKLILSNIYKGIITIPEFRTTFWGYNLIHNELITTWIGLTVGLVAMFCLRRSPWALTFLVISFLGLSGFMNLKFAGHLRHHGHFTLALLFALWISLYEKGYTRGPILAILLIQLYAGVFATYTDIRQPFSYSKYIAAYIRDNYPADIPLTGAYNDMSTPVAGYLQRKIYFLNDGRYSNHVVWSKKYWNFQNYDFPQEELFRRVDKYAAGKKGKYLLIMNYRTTEEQEKSALEPGTHIEFSIETRKYRVTSVRSFVGAIVSDENYHLYEMERID